MLSDVKKTIREGLKIVLRSKILVSLIAVALIASFSYEIVDMFWQIHFSENLHIDVHYYGFMVAFSFLVTIFFASHVSKLSGIIGEVKMLILLEFIVFLSTILIGVAQENIVVIGAFISWQAFKSFKEPIFSEYSNRYIPSKERATLISLLNLVGSMGEVLCALSIGALALILSISSLFLLSAVLLLLIIAILFRLKAY